MKQALTNLLLTLALSINLVACSPADNESSSAQQLNNPEPDPISSPAGQLSV